MIRSITLALAAAVPGHSLSAQQTGAVSLLRCGAGSEALCASVQVDLDPAHALRLTRDHGGRAADGWRGRFLRDTALVGVARPAANRRLEGRVMLLLDVSGSMKGSKIGTARLVLRQFLQSLDSLPAGSVQVALAPFGSVDVAPRIGGARFTSPDSAELLIDDLPPPTQENTALYSAVALAVYRLNDEVRRAGDGALGLLVAITDGNNDVRAGDDPGLLEGPSGLAQVAATVEQSPITVGILGIGNLDRPALQTLAGPRGSVFVVSGDPGAYDLIEPLRQISGVLRGSWSVTFRLPSASRAGLGRGWHRLDLGLAAGGDRVAVGSAMWRPPLVALPAFAGAVPPGVLSAAASGPGRSREWATRVLVAGFLAVFLLEVWIVLPRLMGSGLRLARSAPSPAPSPAPLPVGVTTVRRPTGLHRARGIRADLTEAPPRKPDDITAAKARRA